MTEVADGIHVLNYRYLNQNIGVIVGRDEVAVIDTRSSGGQAREILDDVRKLTHLPVTVVIDTHGHSDHAFGNAVFRPAAIWGHRGCPPFLTADRRASSERDTAGSCPTRRTTSCGSSSFRPIGWSTRTRPRRRRPRDRAAHVGRGHTDHDLVIRVPDAGVLFAGDLVVKSDSPFFGDSFPLDFPATVDGDRGPRVGDARDRPRRPRGPRVPGPPREGCATLADVARRAHAAGAAWESVVGEVPLPKTSASDGLRRAYAQLNGEI